MDLILTGRTINAEEASAWGVVSRVLPDNKLFDFAVESATQIASYSRPVALMAKEAVNFGAFLFEVLPIVPNKGMHSSSLAEEAPLSQGLL